MSYLGPSKRLSDEAANEIRLLANDLINQLFEWNKVSQLRIIQIQLGVVMKQLAERHARMGRKGVPKRKLDKLRYVEKGTLKRSTT